MLTTAAIHAFAKSLGIKNLKAKGRTRDIILAEIIAMKGWQGELSSTVEFLINGGEIKQLKGKPTPRAPIGNQASAGHMKRKPRDERPGMRQAIIHDIAGMPEGDRENLLAWLRQCDLDIEDENVQIYGKGGLVEEIERWGHKVKVKPVEAVSTKEPKAPREPKEKRVGKKVTLNKDGMVTLPQLCEEFGVEPKTARRKLRAKMSKPDAGWVWPKDEVNAIVQIITK